MSESRKLIGRVVNATRTAVIERVDDAHDVQELQTTALEDEIDDAVPHYQPLGVSFTPAAGAEVLLVTVGSDTMNRIALAAQARGKRPTDAAEGCGGVFRPLDGTWALYLADDGTVHLGAKDPDDFVALASVTDSRLDALEQGLSDLITAYNAHIHITTATIGLGPAVGVIAPTTSTATPPTPGQSVASSIAKVQS